MKKIIPLALLLFTSVILSAQDFTGQWKGEFIDKSTSFTGWGGDRCDYVLELECKGTDDTICRLKGTVNKASKSVEVKETERTKTNVPSTIRNCFQIHKLTYFQKADEQSLEGSWVPVPNQQGDCGFGTTLLTRRVLQKNPAYLTNPVTKKKPVVKPKPQPTAPPVVKTAPKKTTAPVVAKKQPVPAPVVKAKPKPVPPVVVKKESKKPTPPLVARVEPGKKANAESPEIVTRQDVPAVTKPEPQANKPLDDAYKKRNSEIIKTIEIDSTSFTVLLYDNGEIDGDSISLFFNGRLLLSHKRLSDKALKLTLDIDRNQDVNELIMYAENLGTIPPNTALMVVNDGDNRYEVRISSDLQKSGTIRFVHRQKPKQ
jgi:hypothetical protein